MAFVKARSSSHLPPSLPFMLNINSIVSGSGLDATMINTPPRLNLTDKVRVLTACESGVASGGESGGGSGSEEGGAGRRRSFSQGSVMPGSGECEDQHENLVDVTGSSRTGGGRRRRSWSEDKRGAGNARGEVGVGVGKRGGLRRARSSAREEFAALRERLLSPGRRVRMGDSTECCMGELSWCLCFAMACTLVIFCILTTIVVTNCCS
ncbi:unnamed protein product [Choristocarpus tenellus]